jgi:aminoglycoside 6'-N-acetyltransferase
MLALAPTLQHLAANPLDEAPAIPSVTRETPIWLKAPMITFERLTRDDFGLLSRWLAEPHVARWWNHNPSAEAVEGDFGGTVDGREPARDHLVLHDGAPIGLIQYCRFHDYPEYVAEMALPYPVDEGTGSIDYLIGDPARIGRGLGAELIGQFVEHIWASEPSTTHIVVPVNSANTASWRALLKAGFRLVARGEFQPDNPTDDRMHEILRIDRPAMAPEPLE